MTTATAPVKVEREILETIERDGMRLHRYRWTVSGGDNRPPVTGEEWASERIEPLSREILEDRWRGLLREMDDEPSTLQGDLDTVLFALIEGLMRRDVSADSAVIDGQITGLDVIVDLDDLTAVIREWMMERAAGIAR